MYMTDENIIKLYFERSELAILETDKKYSRLCNNVAENILKIREDIEECINDTYLSVWNKIPPVKPHIFSAFLCKITKNLALKKYEYLTAEKRNPNLEVVLLELEECVSGRESIEDHINEKELVILITNFLRQQRQRERAVFILRYWYLEPIHQIAKKTGCSKSNVKVILMRTRRQLQEYLTKEGIKI